MNKMAFIALVTAWVAVPCRALAADDQVGTGETDGYVLVWQDLFDADELNTDRWNIEVNGNGGGNSELQYYTLREDNVSLGDDGEGNGCLIITAKRESWMGKKFTSGRINSMGKIRFKHGKIEAAIKFPSTADGLWPAFWMMGDDYSDNGWPYCGETDIVEMGAAAGISAGTQARYFNGACHWGPNSSNAMSYAQNSTKSYSLQDGQFHLFTLVWTESKVAMYVDWDVYPVQTPYYQMTISDTTSTSSPGTYLHKENFILFNLAVGGSFTGIYSSDGITALNDDNDNQASMYVNYVRVYQQGTDDESYTFDDPGDAASVEQVSKSGSGIRVTPSGVKASGRVDVDVYTVSGAKAFSASGDSYVAFEGLAEGIYIVSATDASGNTTTTKAVIK